jgi:4-diphosphocytidyl-2-C-methyl-D-erythritol kinase
MLRITAPAKINWFLRVHGLRKDGYHDIQSLIQKVSLYDVLSFRPSERLSLLSDIQIPEEQNIVYRAALHLKETCGYRSGAEICLTKNIPIAAGLGGGSSDAAAALSALNTLWSLGLSHNELLDTASQIGSDVPFFLNGPLALVEGRGEKVFPIKTNNIVHMLLVNPRVSVSTRWAYAQFSASGNSPYNGKLTKRAYKSDNIKLLSRAVADGDTGSDFHYTFLNDLEPVTLKTFPVIAEIKEKLLRDGAVFSMMSGSGSTVFGLFDTEYDARNAEKVFKDCWTAVVHTLTD